MSSFRIRPRFRQVVDLNPDELRERIARQLSGEESPCEVKHCEGFVSLRIREEEEHVWSPQLNLSLTPDEEGGTIVRGTYGPSANVWSLFLYGYIMTGFLGTISTIFALCQWTIGDEPWALWIVGAVLAAAVSLYFVAQLGQKLGARQTFQLHHAYESAVGNPVEIA